MKRLFLALLGVAVVVSCAFMLAQSRSATGEGPRPPELKVTAGGAAIPVKLGSYCWYERGKGICADTFAPFEMFKDEQPVQVRPGTVVTLSFARAPKEVGLNLWVDGQAVPARLQEGYTFTVPDKPGIYVFSPHGQWPGRGDGSYAFQLQVP
ncbi:MAG TPA: hypothetical protein VNT75_12290 [Symbiobacteriaceae bacterium]|nr:hypothetical protein [Symbiobacteriaceae bacterium]